MMFSNLRGIANLYPIYEGENESWERFNRIFELTEKLSPLFLVQVPRCNNLCKCWDDIAMFWKKNAFALSNTNFMYEAIYHIHNSRFSEKVEKSDALKLVLLIEDGLLRCGYAFRVWKDMEAFIEPLRRILHTTTSNKKNKKTYSKTLEAYKKGRTMMLIMLKGMNEDAWGDRLDCQWAVYPYGLWRVQRDIESFEKAIDYLIPESCQWREEWVDEKVIIASILDTYQIDFSNDGQGFDALIKLVLDRKNALHNAPLLYRMVKMSPKLCERLWADESDVFLEKCFLNIYGRYKRGKKNSKRSCYSRECVIQHWLYQWISQKCEAWATEADGIQTNPKRHKIAKARFEIAAGI